MLGRASDLVRCEERFRPLVERLLGTVFVVESREVAAELAHASIGGMRFVSLDGEVWERGRVRAGQHARARAACCTARWRSASCRAGWPSCRSRSRARRTSATALEGARTAAIEQRDQSRWLLDESQTALETQVRELSGVEREKGFAGQGGRGARREMQNHALELETLARSLAQAEAELAEFQAQLDAARAQLHEADLEVRALELRRDEASARAQVLARGAAAALARGRRVGGAVGARRADRARAAKPASARATRRRRSTAAASPRSRPRSRGCRPG